MKHKNGGIALLGRNDGVIEVHNQPNQVYIRMRTPDGEKPEMAFNDRVALVYNMPVAVGYDPIADNQLFQVLKVAPFIAELSKNV